MEQFDLHAYLEAGVERVLRDLLRCGGRGAFFLPFLARAKKAAKLRREKGGPAFLIASITPACNLRCAGCYARKGHREEAPLLTPEEWRGIFRQAGDMGVSFILLAGGEPLLRREVLSMAAKEKRILFPVFTNGTMLTEDYADFLKASPNLIPVVSIEGDGEKTDARRGVGTYAKIQEAMERLKLRKIPFGVSVTVDRNNLESVTQRGFLEELLAMGCRGAVYVEYVPAQLGTESLVLEEAQREELTRRVQELRGACPSLLLASFPGDELASGGCLAAGRGFFHLNPWGGAEPCPFFPHGDMDVREHSLQEVLQSPLFRELREGGLLTESHSGGCVLFGRETELLH